MINLLFSGNSKVFDGVLTCLLSIFKRTKSTEPVTAYILTMDVSRIKPDYTPISDGECQFLESVCKGYNPQNKIIKLDITHLYEEHFGGCPNEGAYCSPYTLLRLFADMIEGIPDKILYLDVDLLFNRDIKLLYDIDVEEVEYAAARDHYGKYLVHPNYVNAGVLLFNMKKCKQTGIFERARGLIKTKKLVFADQSALIRSTTTKKMLPQKFNDQKFLHKNTIIRHFSKRLFYTPYPHTDNIKQWDVTRVHTVFKYTAFDDVLYEYVYLKQKFLREIEQKDI